MHEYHDGTSTHPAAAVYLYWSWTSIILVQEIDLITAVLRFTPAALCVSFTALQQHLFAQVIYSRMICTSSTISRTYIRVWYLWITRYFELGICEVMFMFSCFQKIVFRSQFPIHKAWYTAEASAETSKGQRSPVGRELSGLYLLYCKVLRITSSGILSMMAEFWEKRRGDLSPVLSAYSNSSTGAAGHILRGTSRSHTGGRSK